MKKRKKEKKKEKEFFFKEFERFKNPFFLISDTQVRLDLVEHIPHVATICQESPHLFDNVVHDHLLGIIIKYLQDQDNQVNISMIHVPVTTYYRTIAFIDKYLFSEKSLYESPDIFDSPDVYPSPSRIVFFSLLLFRQVTVTRQRIIKSIEDFLFFFSFWLLA